MYVCVWERERLLFETKLATVKQFVGSIVLSNMQHILKTTGIDVAVHDKNILVFYLLGWPNLGFMLTVPRKHVGNVLNKLSNAVIDITFILQLI